MRPAALRKIFGDQELICPKLTEYERFFYPSEQVSVDGTRTSSRLQRHLLFLIGVGSHLDCRAAITRGGTRTLARHQKTGEAD